MILELFAKCKSAKEFWSRIPRDLPNNIEFRKELHACLTDHKKLIPAFTTWCREYKAIVFDTCLWTYNPRKKPGYQNRPFILRPRQIKAVERLCHAIDHSHDLIIDKSRDEGASEMICKMFTIYWLFEPQVYFLIGSRKEELVDKSVNIDNGRVIGPHQTLMHKIMYTIAHLPVWWKVNFTKSHCFLQNLDNDSVIQGEATNDSFGAGNRATAVLVDEHARMEPPIAQFISDNIRDTTDVAIFNSTHFKWGAGHPYAKLLRDDKIEKFELGWEHNPEKNVGLYFSPAKDMIQIRDIEYYRRVCPVFNNIEKDEIFDWQELQRTHDTGDIRFIADGGVSNFGCQRSLWFDKETVDRSRSMIDIAQNILRIPHGSAEMFFSSQLLGLYKNKFGVALDDEDVLRGRLKTQSDHKGKVTTVEFNEHIDHTFQWYSELKLLRGKLCPNPRHNYIVACDISRGTGSSNSVAVVIDVNLCKVVGVYVNAYIDVTDFAELAVGLSRWCNNAYLIWEANGPGDTFGKRVLKQGYHNIYWNKDERVEKGGKHGKKPGWYNTSGVNGSKYAILESMDTGMTEALKHERNFHYLIIPDHYTLEEMMDYIFAERRTDVVSTKETGMTSSEGEFAHGDRVIATSLGFFALKYQPARNFQEVRTPPNHSFQARYNRWVRKKKTDKQGRRKYRY